MSAPPAWPKGRPSPKRGTRHGWAGDWGPLSDRRSRLSRLKERIERDLVAKYQPKTELDRVKIEQAAQLRALATASGSSLGVDLKPTAGRFGKLLRIADGSEARIAEQLGVRNGGNGHNAGADLAERLLALPPLSPGASS